MIEAATQRKYSLIRDRPADEDHFKTHSRLAAAIATAISDNPDIQTIGLLGRWGSGKSTAIAQLERLLRADKTTEYVIFPYDAWLHQHDPVRRSFLEELVAFSARRGFVTSPQLGDRIKETLGLTKTTNSVETPKLTADAQALLFSLLPVPLGAALIGLDTIKEAFGSDTTKGGIFTFWLAIAFVCMPIWVWLVRYAWRRTWNGWASLFSRDFWQIRDPEGEPGSLLPVFLNQQSRSTSTTTLSNPEPTSIEFSSIFGEISSSLCGENRRLVVVVDNLDRVPETESLQIWATIRSFFREANDTSRETAVTRPPLVVLPIDVEAIRRMFEMSHTKDLSSDLTRSFINKTFDVTFEVTRPVGSDWHAFLSKQLQFAFGEDLPFEVGFWTRKLFEAKLKLREDNAPTPREINRLVNGVVALVLQWGTEQIPIAIQSAYVIFRQAINSDILGYITSDHPYLNQISSDWQREIAALYFGVDKDKASQALLEGPLRQIIISGEYSKLDELKLIPGFDAALEQISESPPVLDDTEGTSFEVLSLFVKMLNSLGVTEDPTRGRIWQNMIDLYYRVGSSKFGKADVAATVGSLGRHLGYEQASRFVEFTADLATGMFRRDTLTADDQKEARTLAAHSIRIAKELELDVPTFALGSQPTIVLRRLRQVVTTPEVLAQCTTDVDAGELDATLATLLIKADDAVPGASAKQAQASFAAVYAAAPDAFSEFADRAALDWKQTLAACATVISEGLTTERPQEALRLLIEARKQLTDPSSVDTAIQTVSTNGTLQARLGEAVAANRTSEIAIFSAALLVAEIDFAVDTGWEAVLKRHPGVVKTITYIIRDLRNGVSIYTIWSGFEKAKSSRHLVIALIRYGIESKDLGKLNAKHVVENRAYFLRPIPLFLESAFIREVSQYPGFWNSVESSPVDESLHAVANYLVKGSGTSEDAKGLILRKAAATTEPEWSSMIQTGAEPYGLFSEQPTGSIGLFDKRSALGKALMANVPLLFTGDRNVRKRWANFYKRLAPRAQRMAVDTVIEHSLTGSAGPNFLGAIRSVSDPFSSQLWAKRPDDVIGEIILRQSANKAGRAWLREHASKLKNVVSKASDAATRRLTERLARLKSANNDEQRYWAEICQAEWKL